jgi:hydroxymethylpyrimidine pyrophosphatase-like HAD family hydrolase
MRIASHLRALAVDFDGTLTESGGRPADAVLDALARFRATGRRTLLVTGRIWSELIEVFPDVAGHFDLIVAENGAVLFHHGGPRPIAEPVDRLLDRDLAGEGVPFRRGQVLLATSATYGATVAAVKHRLGIECQLVRNRDELMVLPSGVSKGSGVVHALAEAGISPHNTITVGDAENDYSLLAAGEIGVAVANAVSHVRERADLVTMHPNGQGIIELLHGDVVSGARTLHPPRWHVELGTDTDGHPVRIPSYGLQVLIAGPSGSGKSYLAGLVAERLIRLGYTLLVSDPEGDHLRLDDLPGMVRIDTSEPFSPERIVALMNHRAGGVVLDLTGVGQAARDQLFTHLPPVIEAFRAATGIPHWVLLDEAHQPLGWAGPSRPFYTPGHSFCLVTYAPDLLSDDVLAALDVGLLLPGTEVAARVRELAGWPGDNLDRALAGLAPGHAVVVRRPGSAEASPHVEVIRLAARETSHVRHRHKYLAALLPPGKRFRFRTTGGDETGLQAANLAELHRGVAHSPQDVIRHHARHRDFSHWFEDVFADAALAATARELEEAIECADGVEAIRDALLLAIETRYLRGDHEPPGS